MIAVYHTALTLITNTVLYLPPHDNLFSDSFLKPYFYQPQQMSYNITVIPSICNIYLKNKQNKPPIVPLQFHNPSSLCNLSIFSVFQFLPSSLANQCSLQELKLASTQNPRRQQRKVCNPLEAEVLHLYFVDREKKLWLGTDYFLQHSKTIEFVVQFLWFSSHFLPSHFNLAPLTDRKPCIFLAESVFLWLVCCN